MESSAEPNKNSSSNTKVVIIAVVMVLCAVIIAASVLLSNSRDAGGSQALGYASEAKVMLDEDSLQAAVEEAMKNAREHNVALQYKNDAYSGDGASFDCHIVNAAENSYDMFLTIFADPEMTDQIFLSGLVPPGSGFESITLDRALESGDHMVYVALTQVKNDEEGNQVIHNQVVHTMDFHVSQ